TVLSLLIGLFVLTRDSKRPINRVYAVTTLAFVVIIVANSLTIGSGISPYMSLFFMRIVIAATSVAIVGLYFLVVLVRNDKLRILRETKYRVVILITAAVVALEISPAVFPDISFQGGQPIPVPGLAAPIFVLH